MNEIYRNESSRNCYFSHIKEKIWEYIWLGEYCQGLQMNASKLNDAIKTADDNLVFLSHFLEENE